MTRMLVLPQEEKLKKELYDFLIDLSKIVKERGTRVNELPDKATPFAKLVENIIIQERKKI